MKRFLFLFLGCVIGLAAFVSLPYLGMALHDLLSPSPDISIGGTVFLVALMGSLFLGAFTLMVRLFHYANIVGSKDKKSSINRETPSE